MGEFGGWKNGNCRGKMGEFWLWDGPGKMGITGENLEGGSVQLQGEFGIWDYPLKSGNYRENVGMCCCQELEFRAKSGISGDFGADFPSN